MTWRLSKSLPKDLNLFVLSVSSHSLWPSWYLFWPFIHCEQSPHVEERGPVMEEEVKSVNVYTGLVRTVQQMVTRSWRRRGEEKIDDLQWTRHSRSEDPLSVLDYTIGLISSPQLSDVYQRTKNWYLTKVGGIEYSEHHFWLPDPYTFPSPETRSFWKGTTYPLTNDSGTHLTRNFFSFSYTSLYSSGKGHLRKLQEFHHCWCYLWSFNDGGGNHKCVIRTAVIEKTRREGIPKGLGTNGV